MTTTAQLRELRAAAETAKTEHGENSTEHLAAHNTYVDAAWVSTPSMIKAVIVEATSR